jgi:hypothetical protein
LLTSSGVILLSRSQLEAYLKARFGPEAELLTFSRIGEAADDSPKKYGYGAPVLVRYRKNGEHHGVVLETMSPGPFGHEHRADRAQAILWDFDSYDRLPRHVRALDVGAFGPQGELKSWAGWDEPFLVTEFVEGQSYAQDLERLAETDHLRGEDNERMVALVKYLVQVHAVRRPDPNLYRRRLRELIGHGECIMGLTDTYPLPFEMITGRTLRQIEDAANAWRWRLHDRSNRLCQVHGDFHPWNVLFRAGTDFSVLDRSRGEWGDAADDLTSMSINYLFFSLRRHGRLRGAFEVLFREMWDRYRELSGDWEIGAVAAPFFAFRGLVLAHPRWYPDLAWGVRRSLLSFVENVLADERFDPEAVNRYCEV